MRHAVFAYFRKKIFITEGARELRSVPKAQADLIGRPVKIESRLLYIVDIH